MTKIAKCLCCGNEGYSEQQHWPVPKRHGGTETIALCVPCHDAADRLSVKEWELPSAFGGFLNIWEHLSVDGRLVLMRFVSAVQDVADEDADDESVEKLASKFVEALHNCEQKARAERRRNRGKASQRELAHLFQKIDENRILLNRVLRGQDHLVDLVKEIDRPRGTFAAEAMDAVFGKPRKLENGAKA